MWPEAYAIIPKVKNTIADKPVARPSKPSVRFIAFELPVRTKILNIINRTSPIAIDPY